MKGGNMTIWIVKRYLVETMYVEAKTKEEAINDSINVNFNSEVLKFTARKVKSGETYLKMEKKK